MTADARPTALRALECLQELALEKGLDDVSMRDVAKRSGISLAALQYYYPNKAALLDAFVSQTVECYRRRIEAILATSPEGERFANLVRFTATETVQANRHGLLAMIEGRASHDDAARHAVGLFLQSYLIMMRDALAADAPDMPPAEALLQASLVVSMLEGLPSLVEPASNLGLDREALVAGAARTATAFAHPVK
jgi:AcrR family transcriptional regulator